jgi:flagellar biosynthesis component FlhA
MEVSMDSRSLPGPLRGRIGEVALETALGRIVLHTGSVLGECRGEIGALLSAIVVDGLAWCLWLVLIVIAACRTTVMLTATALRCGGRHGVVPTLLLSVAAALVAEAVGLMTGFRAPAFLVIAVLFAAMAVNLIEQRAEDPSDDEANELSTPEEQQFDSKQRRLYTPTVLEKDSITGQPGHHSAQASLSS